MTKLIIVESPKKCKYISEILGPDHIVMPSFGHVRDLPAKELGVDVENGFKPKYQTVRNKNNPMPKIRAAADQAEVIYLAADPDREGEAIAWHIYELLPARVKEKCLRVTFKEITKEGVLKGIQSPRGLDMGMVNSQQARRILDRLAGFEVSPMLWAKIKGRKGLSAGRVQSAALQLLHDRHKEIAEFVPEDIFSIYGLFQVGRLQKVEIKGELISFGGEEINITTMGEAEKLAIKISGSKFKISRVELDTIQKRPPQALETTTMLQEANRLLGFPAEKTMKLAQELYEGLSGSGEGLITYIRTDSTRVSTEASEEAAEYITHTYGPQYLGDENVGKVGNQDAHEAIRPTSVEKHPNTIKNILNTDQYKLYSLIYNRFLASQMAPAEYEELKIDIEGTKTIKQLIFSKEYISVFTLVRQNLVFPGYRLLYINGEEDADQSQDLTFIDLKKITQNQQIDEKEIYWVKNETKPPSHYSESSLIKRLDKLGIGRPSTYASIISLLQKRDYAQLNGDKRLEITPLGTEVAKVLDLVFPTLVDYTFTARMEKQLDLVAGGELPWQHVLEEFYSEIDKAKRKTKMN